MPYRNISRATSTSRSASRQTPFPWSRSSTSLPNPSDESSSLSPIPQSPIPSSRSGHDLVNVGTRSANRSQSPSQSRPPRGTQRQSFATISNIDEATIMGGTFLNSTGPVTIFDGVSPENRSLHGGYPSPDNISNDNNSHPTVFPVESDIRCHQKPDYDIYYHQLLGKGRGTPLWQPGPSMALPKAYRRRGIGIGDVGILYRSGDFDFLFNILLPADHEINEGRVPDGFRPLERSKVEKNGVSRHISYGPGSCLASSTVRRTSNVNSTNFVFETTDREGAILIMPDGALSEDLRNHNLVEKYIATNAKGWYEYVEGDDCGRRIENGDIRVVIGFDKVSSWGIATFASNVDELVRFEFKGVNDWPTYMWDCVGSGSGRVGPQEEEIRDLQLELHASPLRNQCVFMRTLNFTLSGIVQNKLAVHEVRSNDVEISSSPRMNKGASHSGTSKSQREGITFHHSQSGRTILHPSKFLNECLLEKFPNAEMVITKDFDWMSVVSEDVAIPDAEELCTRVLASHIICEDVAGVITLKRRAPDFSSGSNLTLNPIYAGGSFILNNNLTVALTNSEALPSVPQEYAAVLPPRGSSNDHRLLTIQKEDEFATDDAGTLSLDMGPHKSPSRHKQHIESTFTSSTPELTIPKLTNLDTLLQSPASEIVGTPFATNSKKFEYPFPDISACSASASLSDLHTPPMVSTPPMLSTLMLSIPPLPCLILESGDSSSSSSTTSSSSSLQCVHPRLKPTNPPTPPSLIKKRPRWGLSIRGRRWYESRSSGESEEGGLSMTGFLDLES